MVDTNILPQGIKDSIKGFMATLSSSDVAETITYILSTPQSVQIQDIIVKHLEERFWS